MPPQPDDTPFTGYRRRVELVPFEGGIEAGLEDDFHRFTLKLAVEGDRIVAVDGATDRVPWSTCPGALGYLANAVVGRTCEEVQGMARASDHCTHLLDLAVLTSAHAADTRRTRFDMTVSDPVDGLREARLRQDGRETLAWTLAKELIIGPADFADLDLRKLRQWVGALPPALGEQAFLLRRGVLISGARAIKVDALFDAAAHRRRRAGVCYTYTGDRLQDTARKPGWRRDFSARPDLLLAGWPPTDSR